MTHVSTIQHCCAGDEGAHPGDHHPQGDAVVAVQGRG